MRRELSRGLNERYTLCEVLIKYVMPPARAMLARVLAREYRLSQLEISRVLGVSQPLINYYLTGRRRVRGEEVLGRVEGFTEVLREAASIIIDSIKSEGRSPPPICVICRLLRTSGVLKDVLKCLGIREDLIRVPDTFRLKH